MNILSYPHGLHMVRKSTCQCRQFNYCNQICQVNRQNLKLYKCCWHGFNIIQRLFSHVKLSYNCGLQQCVAVWEETGVIFLVYKSFWCVHGVNDIINNLHLVNTFPNVHKTSPYVSFSFASFSAVFWSIYVGYMFHRLRLYTATRLLPSWDDRTFHWSRCMLFFRGTDTQVAVRVSKVQWICRQCSLERAVPEGCQKFQQLDSHSIRNPTLLRTCHLLTFVDGELVISDDVSPDVDRHCTPEFVLQWLLSDLFKYRVSIDRL